MCICSMWNIQIDLTHFSLDLPHLFYKDVFIYTLFFLARKCPYTIRVLKLEYFCLDTEFLRVSLQYKKCLILSSDYTVQWFIFRLSLNFFFSRLWKENKVQQCILEAFKDNGVWSRKMSRSTMFWMILFMIKGKKWNSLKFKLCRM